MPSARAQIAPNVSVVSSRPLLFSQAMACSLRRPGKTACRCGMAKASSLIVCHHAGFSTPSSKRSRPATATSSTTMTTTTATDRLPQTYSQHVQ